MACVSVIVPVYNAELKITRCVQSLINQTLKDIEIILVDDGSTDRSGVICDEFANTYDNIKVIHCNNNGVSVARNLGIKKAVGDFIGFVDSDDYAEPNMFECLTQHMKETDCVICGFYENGEKNNIIKSNAKINNIQAIEYIVSSNYCKGYVWNKLFKKDIIDMHSISFPTNVSMCEDLIFCINYIEQISTVVILKEILYWYDNENSNSVSSKHFSDKRFSVIKAYNYLLSKSIIYQHTYIYRDILCSKAKHCLSLWNMLRTEERNMRKQYGYIIKREIKTTGYYYLLSNKYDLKHKILFCILKIF